MALRVAGSSPVIHPRLPPLCGGKRRKPQSEPLRLPAFCPFRAAAAFFFGRPAERRGGFFHPWLFSEVRLSRLSGRLRGREAALSGGFRRTVSGTAEQARPPRESNKRVHQINIRMWRNWQRATFGSEIGAGSSAGKRRSSPKSRPAKSLDSRTFLQIFSALQKTKNRVEFALDHGLSHFYANEKME